MALEQSIFKATKVMLDVAPDDDSFDPQIMTFINSALADLVDLGVGPNPGLSIDAGESNDLSWDDFHESVQITDWTKNWIYLKVRMVWDPPQVSFLMEAHQKQIDEATWRLVNAKDAERYAARQLGVVEVVNING